MYVRLLLSSQYWSTEITLQSLSSSILLVVRSHARAGISPLFASHEAPRPLQSRHMFLTLSLIDLVRFL